MTARLSIICIWVCFILLLVLGVVMVASTGSCVQGQAELPWYDTFLGKQCMFALLGLVIALGLSRVDYHVWRRVVYVAWWGCLVLLICCYLPGIGKEWHYDEIAKNNPFFAQVWYTNHTKEENNVYEFDRIFDGWEAKK